MQVAPSISMGEWFDERVGNMEQGIPSNAQPDRHLRPAGPENNGPASTRGTRTTSRRASRGVEPDRRERLPARVDRRRGDVIRGGYTKVFDRVGLGLATNFDEGFSFGMSTTINSPFGA